MTTSIPLPIGSFARRDPRAGSRRLVNCFSDPDDPNAPVTIGSDVKNPSPVKMRRWAGTTSFANDGTINPVRGARMMRGIQYVVIGPTLYSVVSSSGALIQIGTGIPLGGFVRMADNSNCLFILIPGTSIAFTYCPQGGTGFSQFLNPFFLQYGALDVWFIDTFFVFLISKQTQGNGFYNDDGTAISGVGPPTFTTGAVFFREFATDPFVGMCVDHREVMCFGQKTTEGYINVGNAVGSPFQSAPDSFMQFGCHLLAGYTVALQDQSVFWIGQDRTVRRRNGQTPTRVSNSGIEEILEKADLTGCYALTPTVAGHPLWVLTMPVLGRTLVYDCLVQEWFELVSQGLGYWQPLCHFEAFGGQYVGSGQTGQIGLLDTTIFTEFGQPMVSQFTTQSIYDMNNRITHRRLEAVITVGESPQLNVAPKLSLFVSDDGGQTFRANGSPATLGIEGQYSARATWFNLGQARSRVYVFELSDPTPMYTIDMTTELSGGKW